VLNVTFEGVHFTVEYEYEPAERGARERGTGLQLEPDYDEQFYLVSVKVGDDAQDILEYLDPHFRERLTDEVKLQWEDGRE